MAMGKLPKESVRLRRRQMPSGNVSLYLDIYINGQRGYEYLKLYLQPEHNRGDRERNRQTLDFAEAIRAKRLLEVRNGEYGFKNRDRESVGLLAHYRKLCEAKDKKDTHGNYGVWKGSLAYLCRFVGKCDIPLSQVDSTWLEGFRKYLYRQELAQNTKAMYYTKLCACLHDAYCREIIRRDPTRKAKRIPTEETERVYLTIDEVRRLTGATCCNQEVRRAFLFSCLTGLRQSDVRRLTWGDVGRQGEFTRITFRQKKTGGQEYIDIAEEAAGLLGERGRDRDAVFRLPSYSNAGACLLKWAGAAGIGKHVTFHSARHTFAVMMLDLGTDIYTVSKLLGHKDIATTQIYAKVLDKNKQSAVSRIPSIFQH